MQLFIQMVEKCSNK